MISQDSFFNDDGTLNTPLCFEWMRHNSMVPFSAVILYLLLVFGGKKWMENRPAYKLKWPLAAWNTFLAVFSLVGVVSLLPNFIGSMLPEGVQETVCTLSITENYRVGVWFIVFLISKFVELGDTIFIVLRKSSLQFLHWYHHITVLVYSWFALAAGMFSAGHWFMSINVFVHVLMYSYFAIRSFGIRTPSSIAMLITMLQILQMITGLYVNFVSLKFHVLGRTECFFSWNYFFFTCCLYGSYAILFIHFFYKKYVSTNSRSKKD